MRRASRACTAGIGIAVLALGAGAGQASAEVGGDRASTPTIVGSAHGGGYGEPGTTPGLPPRVGLPIPEEPGIPGPGPICLPGPPGFIARAVTGSVVRSPAPEPICMSYPPAPDDAG